MKAQDQDISVRSVKRLPNKKGPPILEVVMQSKTASKTIKTTLTAKQVRLLQQAEADNLNRAKLLKQRQKKQATAKVAIDETFDEANAKDLKPGDAVKVRVLTNGKLCETLILKVIQVTRDKIAAVVRDSVKFAKYHGYKNEQQVKVPTSAVAVAFKNVTWMGDCFYANH